MPQRYQLGPNVVALHAARNDRRHDRPVAITRLVLPKRLIENPLRSLYTRFSVHPFPLGSREAAPAASRSGLERDFECPSAPPPNWPVAPLSWVPRLDTSDCSRDLTHAVTTCARHGASASQQTAHRKRYLPGRLPQRTKQVFLPVVIGHIFLCRREDLSGQRDHG